MVRTEIAAAAAVVIARTLDAASAEVAQADASVGALAGAAGTGIEPVAACTLVLWAHTGSCQL